MRRLAQLKPQRGQPGELDVQHGDDLAKSMKKHGPLGAPVYLGKVSFNGRTIPSAVAIHGDQKGYVHTGNPQFGSINPKRNPEQWKQYLSSMGWPANTQPLSCFGQQAGGGGADYGGEIEIGMAEVPSGEQRFTLKGD